MNKKEKSEHDALMLQLKQAHDDHVEMINQMQAMIASFNRLTQELRKLRVG